MYPSPLAKSTVTSQDIFSRLQKGSIHNITGLSCACAPLFAVHYPFPDSSLRASVHSQQSHPSVPPPAPCSDWNLCLARSIIFSTTRTYIKQIIIFISLQLYVFLRFIIYVMVLYWTRSHSFVRFLGCGTTV